MDSNAVSIFVSGVLEEGIDGEMNVGEIAVVFF
jgi:hypothetical protein